MPDTSRLPDAFRDVDTWIFDCDGVITSEEGYFDAAGLTIREVLESPFYLGLSPPDYSSVPEICYRRLASMDRSERRKYLARDFIIAVKARGLNSNWDLAYLVIGIYLGDLLGAAIRAVHCGDLEALDEVQAPSEVLETWREAKERGAWRSALRLEHLTPWGELLREQGISVTPRHELHLQLVDDFRPDVRGLGILDELNHRLSSARSDPATADAAPFGRPSPFWSECQTLFQEWYLGPELYEKIYERSIRFGPKPGLVRSEAPLLGLPRTKRALTAFRDAGFQLGIATGRPVWEVLTPFDSWGISGLFDERRRGTHDLVEAAEAELLELDITKNLSKPDPFLFLRVIHPDASVTQLVEDEALRGSNPRFAAVGDTVADIWAARAAGCPVVAVLSGASGVKAKRQIEEAKPDLIVQDIGELAEMVAG